MLVEKIGESPVISNSQKEEGKKTQMPRTHDSFSLVFQDIKLKVTTECCFIPMRLEENKKFENAWCRQRCRMMEKTLYTLVDKSVS